VFVHLFAKMLKAAAAVALGCLVNHRPSLLKLSPIKPFHGSSLKGRVPHRNRRQAT
jgi:hypothetical protein